MTKLAEGFTSELAKGLWVRVLSPACVFWMIGWFVVSARIDSREFLAWLHSRIANASSEQISWAVIAIAALLLVIVSSWLAERATLLILRLLEGYWPNNGGFRQWKIRRMQHHFDTTYAKWERLARLPTQTSEQSSEWVNLDHKLRRFPKRAKILPTQLGNILAAAETRPIDKYGLDATICWPRLWLLLSKEEREIISPTRARLDDGARLWLWSILSLIWGVFAWWLVPIALAAAWASYRATLSAAGDFADLVESAFDTRRLLLYKALGWPTPKTPAQEKETGQAITKYLLRGSDDDVPTFDWSGQ